MQTLSDVMRREMAHLGVRVITVELGEHVHESRYFVC